METSEYLVAPKAKVRLDRIPTRYDGKMEKAEGEERFAKATRRLAELQEILYAENRHGVLVVLQAMDAGGKDSTIRHVFGPLNPQGCRVTGFKAPTEEERGHDFLWRVHAHAPGRGRIAVFNRSHYEDVLIVRVKGLAPKKVWRARYAHINAFERMLADEGTVIRKFFLHISKDYQRERLQRRLDRPDKHWKFNPDDLAERARWGDYQNAFEEALTRCSTPHAPWYVVPAERRWFRNLLVAEALVETLESLGMSYPPADFDPSTITIDP